MSSPDLAADLPRAIAGAEIVPYFQPLVELRTGRLAGFEVLARWHHASRGLIHPAQFIPIAEQIGLIGSLTEHLLRCAARAASSWPDHLTLSVNISPLQLQDRALAERLRAAIDGTGFPFDRLVFEITEAALIGNLALARIVTGEMRALGARLALDDFGTGYANLHQLQALPFDRLKVDASFVRSMRSRRESRKIVATVIGLGHTLGLSTVAEGVEGQAEADMLISLGCDIGQGWLFGRPQTAADIATQLAADAPQWRMAGDMTSTAADMAHRLEALPSQCVSQLRALYDSAPVGLGLVDTNLRYVALNKRLAEMHNAPVVAHLGRTIPDMVPHIYAQLEPYLRRALRGEDVGSFESRWQEHAAPNAEHVIVVSYHPVRDAADEVIGLSIAVVDITALDRSHPRSDQRDRPGEASSGLAGLTARQREVLRLLATGLPVKGIARQLGLSIGTVKTHLAQAYRILGARNRTEALVRAGLMMSTYPSLSPVSDDARAAHPKASDIPGRGRE
jgi:EAL domain-containing protein (putative c-di-GMP-specific phosphodiesterase class I)/DNA-binding CsgD family transcriptional regulator